MFVAVNLMGCNIKFSFKKKIKKNRTQNTVAGLPFAGKNCGSRCPFDVLEIVNYNPIQRDGIIIS